jgi:protein involved in sex pheromone biosynthesis
MNNDNSHNKDNESGSNQGSEMLLIPLNNFERVAVYLVAKSKKLSSMKDVFFKYGLVNAVEIATKDLGLTEEFCEVFYKNNLDEYFDANFAS